MHACMVYNNVNLRNIWLKRFLAKTTSKNYYVRAKDAKRSMWGDGHDVRWSYC